MTLPELFMSSVQKFPDNPLIWEKSGSSYQACSYREMSTLVNRFAAGLISCGLKQGDRVVLISEGRNDWLMSELAILFCGAINVPVSVKIEELEDLKYRLNHSGARFAIVSEGHAHKVTKIKRDLADLDLVIHLDTAGSYGEDEISKKEVLKKGDQWLQNNQGKLEELWKSLNGNDPANICYTSGTTADPKGIILSHRNYTANVEQASAMFDIPSWYVSLLILPWDHSFGHTTGIYALVKHGASMASVQKGASMLETLRNIPVNIREIKPTFLLSVPALAKNFKKNIEKGIEKKGPRVSRMFNYALSTAYKYNGIGWDKGKGFQLHRKLMLRFFDRILFSKIREQFGGRLNFFVGGGALLDLELQKFFYAIGIPMYQGYGLTEASPVISANSPKAHKLGSSGRLVPDLQIKICDEEGHELPPGQKGEIVIKGENVMTGYWRNDKATQDCIKDEWLYTGDMGFLDSDGFLFVLGRFKSLLIGNDGEKYSPEGIEEAMVEHSPYLEQVMLYNNQDPYTIALVVPNTEQLLKYARQNGHNIHEEKGQNALLKFIQGEVDQFLSAGKYGGVFPERWLPAAIAVLGEGFTEQNHLLNSTLKMVRPKIIEYFKNRIEYLYTSEAKDICNHQNQTIIKRMDS